MTSTYSITTKAVKIFHTEGDEAAQEYMRRAFLGAGWRSGANATKARIATQSVANYRGRASADHRPAALGDLRATVTIAGHVVSAGCDVVTLEGDGGHAGRLCLWSVIPRPFSRNELALLACPIVMALGNELGPDAVVGVEIWMLRADEVQSVGADVAMGQVTNLSTLVRRLTQS